MTLPLLATPNHDCATHKSTLTLIAIFLFPIAIFLFPLPRVGIPFALLEGVLALLYPCWQNLHEPGGDL